MTRLRACRGRQGAPVLAGLCMTLVLLGLTQRTYAEDTSEVPGGTEATLSAPARLPRPIHPNPVLDKMLSGANLSHHLHGLDTSADFLVAVDGRDIYVERYNSVNLAWLTWSQPVEVRITCRKEIRDWRLLPRKHAPVEVKRLHATSRSRQAPVELPGSHAPGGAEQAGNTLAFNLSGPRNLWIEADDVDPLFLFADPPGYTPPQKP